MRYDELPPGPITFLPICDAQRTGTWRTFKPMIDHKRCNHCFLCWKYCPEMAISTDITIDYDYCKGCGICAAECPRKAIRMVRE